MVIGLTGEEYFYCKHCLSQATFDVMTNTYNIKEAKIMEKSIN